MSAQFKCSWCEDPFYYQCDGVEPEIPLALRNGRYHFCRLSCLVRYVAGGRMSWVKLEAGEGILESPRGSEKPDYFRLAPEKIQYEGEDNFPVASCALVDSPAKVVTEPQG